MTNEETTIGVKGRRALDGATIQSASHWYDKNVVVLVMDIIRRITPGSKYVKFIKLAIPILILCILLLSMVFLFRDSIAQILQEETEDKLVEITIQTKRSLEKEIDMKFENLKFISGNIERGITLEQTINNLEKEDISLRDGTLGAVDILGQSIYGPNVDKESLTVFVDGFRGNSKVVYLEKSVFSAEPCVLLIVPLYSNENIKGAVYEVLSGEGMQRLFYSEIFNGKGFTYCAAKQFSTPILPDKVERKNASIALELMDVEKNQIALNKLSQEMFYNDFSAEIFYHGNQSYYIASAALEVMPGWYTLSVIDTRVVQEKLDFILRLSTICFLFLICLFMFVFLALRITEIQSAQQAHRFAYYDDLTGLLSFAGLQLYLNPDKNAQYAIVLFDIDEFHNLNVLMGELYSTNLIKKIAQTLKSFVVETDGELICRTTNNYFVLYLRTEGLKQRVLRLRKACIECSEKADIDISCGIKLLAADEVLSTQTLSCCLFAINQATLVGTANHGDDIALYNVALQKIENENKFMQSRMNEAIAEKEFLVYLQPKFDLQLGTWCGAEALVRWRSQDNGIIQPNRFIPLFEKTGQIDVLDLYVLESVCQIIRRWLDEGRTVLPISVNLSRSNMRTKNLANRLADIVNKYEVPIDKIELELTESAFFTDTEQMIAIMHSIKAKGFHISIDDFGTGYSSLSTLINMPVDTIKLDKSFVDAWQQNEMTTVISGILKIAHKLDIKTVTEGIETKAQSEMLQQLNCQIGQGYYYSRPITVQEYEVLITKEWDD